MARRKAAGAPPSSSCPQSTATFTQNTAVAIPDGPAVVTSTVNVSGVNPYLWDLDMQTFIQHTFAADLDITLTSPAGTVVTITTDNGAGNDNVFNGTLWDDQANPGGQVPYTTNAGLVTDHPYVNLTTASPLVVEEALAAFNGEDPNGVWTLTISDDLAGDGGSLDSWSLEITTITCTTPTPTSTATSTPTATPTSTSTPTVTATPTPTPTSTITPTPTRTPIPGPVKPAAWRAGTWFLRNSLSDGPADLVFAYGLATDKPLMCDWDGNGSKTPGVFRDGAWYLRNTNSAGVADITLLYGFASDTPICGDWDGDGVETVGAVRVQGGQVAWYLRNSNTSGPADVIFLYGLPSDRWVVGDWNGDGVDTPGVLRDGTWYLRNSNTNGPADLVFGYGAPLGDRPIVGNWNRDTVDTVGVLRGNLWYLRNANTSGPPELQFQYGAPGDTLLVWR